MSAAERLSIERVARIKHKLTKSGSMHVEMYVYVCVNEMWNNGLDDLKLNLNGKNL